MLRKLFHDLLFDLAEGVDDKAGSEVDGVGDGKKEVLQVLQQRVHDDVGSEALLETDRPGVLIAWDEVSITVETKEDLSEMGGSCVEEIKGDTAGMTGGNGSANKAVGDDDINGHVDLFRVLLKRKTGEKLSPTRTYPRYNNLKL